MNPTGKIALVTGAGRGIGKAVALKLAEGGATVIVNSLSQPNIDAVVAEIIASGGHALGMAADVSSPAGVLEMFGRIISEYGRIDVLVNNAATYEKTPFEAVSQADWDRFLDTNLRAAFFLSQALAPALRRAGEGKIINIADSSALKPWPDRIPYCVSKAGLLCLTQALAKALAPRIQVNAILPGALLPPKGTSAGAARIFARATLLKRLGTPEDAAKAVVFLIESDYITGASIPVDGGRLAA